MTESTVFPDIHPEVFPDVWVHRNAQGLEIGSEVPTGVPSNAIADFFAAVQVTWEIRETLWMLVLRDFKGRYRAQALGLFWSLAHPLVMMITTTIAFEYVLRVQIAFFPIFYLVGAIFWHFFTNAILAATGAMTDNGGLIKHTTFPRFLFPIAAVLSHLLHFGMELLLVFAFFFVFPDAYRFNFTLVALPLLVFLILLISIGVGLMVSVLHAKYRDLYYVVTSLITIGFWGTPILYSTAMAPAWLRPLLRLNPVGGVIEGARDIMMNGKWPNLEYLLPAFVTGVVVFVVGCLVFRKENVRVSDYV